MKQDTLKGLVIMLSYLTLKKKTIKATFGAQIILAFYLLKYNFLFSPSPVN